MSRIEKEPRWLDNLRLLMEARKFNARSLSLRAGLGATAVRDMLEGRAKFPRYDTVEALAEALEVTTTQLMGGKDLTAENKANDPLKDEDLVLLTEIITRLQETIEQRKQQLGPHDFAAMVTSLYRQMRPIYAPKKTGPTSLSHHIDHLMSYESFRKKQGKQ